MAACFQLGGLYESGQGAPQKYDRAARYYREACEDRHGEACARLAGLYEKGAGVHRDAEQATEYRKEACRFGYQDACPPRSTARAS